MKIEKLNKLCYCNYCNQLLLDPITLPCGENICSKDLNEIKDKCLFCGEAHAVPKQGFQINRLVKELVDLELNKINLDINYNRRKKALNELELKVTELELVMKNPNDYIYEFFTGLRNKVDIRREECKVEVDDHFDTILSNIKTFEAECKLGEKKNDKLVEELEASKLELKIWLNSIDTMSDETISKVEKCKQTLDSNLESWKKQILQNKTYTFEVDHSKEYMKKCFGSIQSKDKVKFED